MEWAAVPGRHPGSPGNSRLNQSLKSGKRLCLRSTLPAVIVPLLVCSALYGAAGAAAAGQSRPLSVPVPGPVGAPCASPRPGAAVPVRPGHPVRPPARPHRDRPRHPAARPADHGRIGTRLPRGTLTDDAHGSPSIFPPDHAGSHRRRSRGHGRPATLSGAGSPVAAPDASLRPPFPEAASVRRGPADPRRMRRVRVLASQAAPPGRGSRGPRREAGDGPGGARPPDPPKEPS
ncbi:hypothetical protein GCM10017688_42230 [Streptomyces ramulosus]